MSDALFWRVKGTVVFSGGNEYNGDLGEGVEGNDSASSECSPSNMFPDFRSLASRFSPRFLLLGRIGEMRLLVFALSPFFASPSSLSCEFPCCNGSWAWEQSSTIESSSESVRLYIMCKSDPQLLFVIRHRLGGKRGRPPFCLSRYAITFYSFLLNDFYRITAMRSFITFCSLDRLVDDRIDATLQIDA